MWASGTNNMCKDPWLLHPFLPQTRPIAYCAHCLTAEVLGLHKSVGSNSHPLTPPSCSSLQKERVGFHPYSPLFSGGKCSCDAGGLAEKEKTGASLVVHSSCASEHQSVSSSRLSSGHWLPQSYSLLFPLLWKFFPCLWLKLFISFSVLQGLIIF